MLTPPHAYIPGQTRRHPEGAFDALKQDIDPADLAASRAFATGLDWYRAGCFWEAHELWEAVWMAAPPNSREQAMLRALIGLANAGLKARMGRPRAVARICDSIRLDARAGCLGIDLEWVRAEADRLQDMQYNAEN